MKRYRIVVVDDDKDVLKALVDLLRDCGFEARGFDEAEKFLAEVLDAFPPCEPTDLALVDLQLKPRKMQGIALVGELAARKNVDCAIMVMSGNLASADMVEAIKLGAGAGIQKPFDRATIVPTLQRLAEVARRRRVYKAQENARTLEPDSSRLHRPVFLSYSSKDDVLANGLRRNIEARGIPVWYAPTTISPGDPWKARIDAGIREASIFLALLTDSYLLTSPHCENELRQFQARVERESEPKPSILPVTFELSNKARRSDLYQQIEMYHGIDMSTRFIDRLTALLLCIERLLGPIAADRQKNRPRPSVTISNKVITMPPHSEKSFS